MKYFLYDKTNKIPSEMIKKLAEFYFRNNWIKDKKIAINSIKNSQDVLMVCDGEKIIGAAKTIGDGIRFITITDLFVDENYRNKGLGKKIVSRLVKKYAKKKLYSININTDPRDPNLVKFYKKCGFLKIKNYHSLKHKNSFINYKR